MAQSPRGRSPIARKKPPAETSGAVPAEPYPPFRIGQRVTVLEDEGQWAGACATVDQLLGEPVYLVAQKRFAEVAKDIGALRDLYEFFLAEARPVWNLEDNRGPVPATVSGMLRQPSDLLLSLIQLWILTYPLPDEEPE